jgi:hypothetical protein
VNQDLNETREIISRAVRTEGCEADNPSASSLQFDESLPCWIATVTLCSKHEKDSSRKAERLALLPEIINPILEAKKSDGIILFPAGWIHAGQDEAKTIYDEITDIVTKTLQKSPHDILVCIGIDGRIDNQGFDHDQVALVISKTRILKEVKKFWGSPQERKIIAGDLEKPSDAKISHLFSFKGKSFFISVCYDICANKSGYKGLNLANPGCDYILNLVHRFSKYIKGQETEGSGVWYFIVHNFGTASRDWNCPVFGTGIFINRDITEKWRTGVNWRLGNISTKSKGISADLFSINYEQIPRIIFPSDCGDRYAEVRFFSDTRVKPDNQIVPCLPSSSTRSYRTQKQDEIYIGTDFFNSVISAFEQTIRPNIPGLERKLKGETQYRYIFDDWLIKGKSNPSIFYEFNDWEKPRAGSESKPEISVEIEFWRDHIENIGQYIQTNKEFIAEKMPVMPRAEWNTTMHKDWSRLRFIFPKNQDPTQNLDPAKIADSMRVLIEETRVIVDNYFVKIRDPQSPLSENFKRCK